MSDNLHLALCGDVMLGRLVNEVIPRRGYAYPWGGMLPLIKAADLFLINQEFALTTHEGLWGSGRKAFYFRAHPDVVNSLTAAGVSFSSLANNHIADFEMEGLLETIEVLDRAGIAHAGAGPDDAAARAPAVLESQGIRVGIVAFADHPREWAAAPDRPGLNYTPISLDPKHFDRVATAIDAAREVADFVIFSIHWGPNMRPRPPAHFQEFARRVIDAGADLFWGHSAHILQGIEVYRGSPILYDTGDFVDDYAVDPDLRNDLTALFQVVIDGNRVRELTLVPAMIDRMQVNPAGGPERAWLVERLTRLSEEFGTRLEATPDQRLITVQINGLEA